MSKRNRWLLGLALLGLAIIIVVVPRPDIYGEFDYSQAVYDRQGRLLRLTLAVDERYRLRVPLSRVAPQLVQATLLYEDRYFYHHSGINPVALLKAGWETYVGGERRGASTITMQLARLRFQIDSSRLLGKLYQIMRALQLEWHYSKDEILEAYLNLAPYGGNIEGIASASLIYFNKTPDQLTLHEALTLAVIPQSPSYRSLDKGAANPGLQAARQEMLQRWLDTFPEDQEQAERLALPVQASGRRQLPFYAPHFVEALLRNEGQQDLHTTLDLRMQQLLERQIRSYLEGQKRLGLSNATAMVLDTRDMSVRALVGSADYFNDEIHGQVNGTEALRSPGSTLKPFIYALALEQGRLHPKSMLKDAPSSYGAYNPENYDHEFNGPVDATDALVRSRNVPAVSLASQLAPRDLYDFMQAAGAQFPESRRHYGLSLVLGGAEVSMRTLVRSYALLANGGKLYPLRMLEEQPQAEGEILLSPEASYLTLQMLAQNPRPNQGFQSQWLRHPLKVQWKTGTSFGFRDAWSVGIVGPYVVAVWVGNFNGEGNPSLIGRRAAAPLFFQIIDALRADYGQDLRYRLPRPDNIKSVKVCAQSGKLPNAYCPVTMKSGFIPGVSPIERCDIHRRVHIDKRTGLRACGEDKRFTESRVYEFWPSDLLQVFRDAGIARLLPPPYLPECKQTAYTQQGSGPEITSPYAQVVYYYQPQKKDQQLPLSAVVDADVRHLYWFVDEQYLGKTDAQTPYYWNMHPGTFQIRVIDDHGRAAEQKLVIKVSE